MKLFIAASRRGSHTICSQSGKSGDKRLNDDRHRPCRDTTAALSGKNYKGPLCEYR